MTFRVVWTVTDVKEEWIEAESEDDAREEWESECGSWDSDRSLFFIEDEDGNQTIYN